MVKEDSPPVATGPTKEEVAAIAQSLIDSRILTPAWLAKLDVEGADFAQLAKELEGKSI